MKTLGYLKAQTFVSKNPEYSSQTVKDVSFTTVADLITALLTELMQNYVVGNKMDDRKMRKRIAKMIELVNGKQEIANLIIRGNPFQSSKQHRFENDQGKIIEVANEDDQSESYESSQDDTSSHTSDYLPSEIDKGDSLNENLSNLQAANSVGKVQNPVKKQHLKIPRQSTERRHNSMIVRGGKESQKWLQEYSNFNLQEQSLNLLQSVHKQHSALSSRDQAEELSQIQGSVNAATTSESSNISQILTTLDSQHPQLAESIS